MEEQPPEHPLAQHAAAGQRILEGGPGTEQQQDPLLQVLAALQVLQAGMDRVQGEVGQLRQQGEGVHTLMSDVLSRIGVVENMPPTVQIIPPGLLYQDAGAVSFGGVIGSKEAVVQMEKMADFCAPGVVNIASPIMSVQVYGPSGSGKTMLARAFANKTGWHFIPCNVVHARQVLLMASRTMVTLTSLFSSAIEAQPCIIELCGSDQLDFDQMKRELTAVRDAKHKIFVIGTTSNWTDINAAEPFESAVGLSNPFEADRCEMFRHFATELSITLDGSSLAYLASQSNSLTGGDIQRILQLSRNEGDLRKVPVDLKIVDETRMTYLSGSNVALEIILPLPDLWLTVLHEVGHAYYSLLNPHARKMSFVTCQPCFGRYGHVVSLRDGDSRTVTGDTLRADIGVALAGKIVEEMFNNGLSSSGCSSDLEKANLMAHDYVVKYAFSPIGTPPSDPGPDWQNQIDVEKKRVIDQAILDVTDELRARRRMIKIIALELLDEKRMRLHEVEELIEKNTLSETSALMEDVNVADLVGRQLEEYIAVPSGSVTEAYMQ